MHVKRYTGISHCRKWHGFYGFDFVLDVIFFRFLYLVFFLSSLSILEPITKANRHIWLAIYSISMGIHTKTFPYFKRFNLNSTYLIRMYIFFSLFLFLFCSSHKYINNFLFRSPPKMLFDVCFFLFVHVYIVSFCGKPIFLCLFLDLFVTWAWHSCVHVSQPLHNNK